MRFHSKIHNSNVYNNKVVRTHNIYTSLTGQPIIYDKVCSCDEEEEDIYSNGEAHQFYGTPGHNYHENIHPKSLTQENFVCDKYPSILPSQFINGSDVSVFELRSVRVPSVSALSSDRSSDKSCTDLPPVSITHSNRQTYSEFPSVSVA